MSLCFTVHVYDTERPLSFTRGLLASAELWANHGNTLRGKKNGVHALGHNSAESEPIWMKSGAL